MAEFVHTFNAGKMNKDLDERLVPQGEYRDALNLDLANSENGNKGSLQTIEGNSQQRGAGINSDDQCDGEFQWTDNYIDNLTDAVCIGSYRHDKTECIYWFIASDEASIIAEYNQTTQSISPVLVDKNNILKFSENYLITGINIIDKFLFWTDNQTEPKKINIEKFRTGSTNFVTHTKIPLYNQQAETYTTNLAGQPDFIEEDITVIKKSPLNSPELNMGASRFGADVPGTGVDFLRTQYSVTNQENFTYIPDVAGDINTYVPISTYGEYLSNISQDPQFYQGTSLGTNWDGQVTFTIQAPPSYGIVDGQAVWQPGDILSLRADHIDDWDNQYEYQARFLIAPNGVNGDNVTVQIQSISSDIIKFYNADGSNIPLTWEVILEEKEPLFEYVFPRFAYRWKYIDNEYSTYSPFTEVAFIPNRFEYVSSDGYNIGMTNNIRKLIIKNLQWGSEEVMEIDILFKESGKNAVYVVDTIKRKDYTSVGGVLSTEFEIKNELVGSIVEANQLLRPWDNVPLRAKAQEIIGNRIVYGNYVQNYTVGTVSLDAQISTIPHPSSSEDIQNGLPDPSLKSIRTYQVGIVYKDQFGRETPVFSSQDSSVYVDISKSDKLTSLQAKMNSQPPQNANITHYKYFIKENSTPYYNLALDRFYPAEDGNVWLSFPSSERNKLDEETYLILKKQHDNNVSVKSLHRYKVLAIENEAPDFVANFRKTLFSGTVQLLSNSGPGFLTVRIEGPGLEQNPNFGNNLSSSNKIIFEKGGFETDEYGIEKAGTAYDAGSPDEPMTFSVKLKTPLGGDAGWMEPLNIGDQIDVTLFEEEPKNLPEFEGRFFAKINRDFAFDENIIKTFDALQKRYVVVDSVDVGFSFHQQGRPNGALNGLYFWGDKGNTSSKGCGGFSCSSEWNDFRSFGPGGWGGMGHRIPDLIKQHYRPPTQHKRWFGYTLIGVQPGVQADDFSGQSTSANEFPQMNGAYFDSGSYIRFFNKTLSEYSEIYQIQQAHHCNSNRGYRKCKRVGCGGLSGNADNRKMIVIGELDRNLEESWFAQYEGDWDTLNSADITMEIVTDVYDGDNKILTSTNPAVFETEPKESADLDLYYESSNVFPISSHSNGQYDQINWFNCYSFGNGAESNRIRDDFNAPVIDKGAKVSTVLDEPYSTEHRGSGFIYSQIYNSTSGINRLNQFIQAEKITKDLNPIHGSIQKLHARDTDLITLCEDKCFRVLANKDALFNADGNVNLTGNNAVLGQTVPYAGEYGISKNPESFSSFAFRSYFADKNRGVVIRLSRDGITVISQNGMSDFFSDNLAAATKIIGSYDEDKGLYNITLNNLTNYWQKHLSIDKDYNLTAECPAVDPANPNNLIKETTVSFDEQVGGWTSRKSFIPESGISLNNTYYTFKNALLWEHGLNPLYNNFYNVQYFSTVNLLINDSPQAVKGYTALNYSGTQSRELEYQHPVNSKWYSIAEVNAGSFIPSSVQVKKEGWYSNFIRTNLESGEIKEFENKEGKYFNYIKTLEVCKSGTGVGDAGPVDQPLQNYYLTTGLTDDCSRNRASGCGAPDTLQSFVTIWDNAKGDLSLDLNIEPLTVAQDVRCAIEDLYYNSYRNGNYSGIINEGVNFSYVFTDGLQVGTQMYDFFTNQPISQAGAYLFTGTQPSDITDVFTVDHAGLAPNNTTAVPVSYYVMILGADGKIASYTQYNTLNSCVGVGDPGKRAYIWSAYSSMELPVPIPENYIITTYNPSAPPVSNAELICAHRNAFDEYFASTLPPCVGGGTRPCKTGSGVGAAPYYYSSSQGGSDSIAVGTQFYSYNFSQEQYIPAFSGGYVGIIDINDYNTRLPQIGRSASVFVQNFWNDTSTIDDKYKIIRIDNNGVVTHLDQINQIPNPTCP